MDTDVIVLLGASGHAKVVFDALVQSGISLDRIMVTDDSVELFGKSLFGSISIVPANESILKGTFFHVAIGRCEIRRAKFEQYEGNGGRPLTIVHPKAVISSFASVGAGSFVAAHAVVGPSACIGKGAILNHGSIVDHDCIVGDYAHIAPNATLGGGVHVGAAVLIGAGAVVLPGIVIGNDAVVGAGSVVLRDVKNGAVIAGVPAMEISR